MRATPDLIVKQLGIILVMNIEASFALVFK
jgi:hypothetical protein